MAILKLFELPKFHGCAAGCRQPTRSPAKQGSNLIVQKKDFLSEQINTLKRFFPTTFLHQLNLFGHLKVTHLFISNLLIFWFCLFFANPIHGQGDSGQALFRERHATNHLIKFSLSPRRNIDNYALGFGFQYELRLRPVTSFTFGADYMSDEVSFTVVPLGTVWQRQTVFCVRPQFRYYIRKNREKVFNGFFTGFSALYFRETNRFDAYSQTTSISGGVSVGYQKIINSRFSIEAEFFYSYSPWTLYSTKNSSGLPDKVGGYHIFWNNIRIGYVF